MLLSGRVGDEVLERLEVEPSVSVMIAFDVPGAPKGKRGPRFDGPAGRSALAVVAESILDRLPPGEFQLRRRFHAIDALSGEVTAVGIEALLKHPRLVRIDLIQEAHFQLAESIPLVGLDRQHEMAYRGVGSTVAVLDSGIDTDHPDLELALVGERCFCTDCCPGGSSTASGPGSAEDDIGHGTTVSGIIASAGAVAPVGGAPGADVFAIRVGGTGSPVSDDIVAALDFLLGSTGIHIVNMSFSTTKRYRGICDNASADTRAWARGINTLRERGVLVFAASGNDGDSSRMGAPACISGTIAVGAVYDYNGSYSSGTCNDPATAPDQVACWSNANEWTALMAPGSNIVTTNIGGGTIAASGTSLASPLAAACAAVLREAQPELTSDEIEAKLKESPVHVTDPKSGLTFPRLDCSLSANPLPASQLLPPAKINNYGDYVAADRSGRLMAVLANHATPAVSNRVFVYRADPASGLWQEEAVLTVPSEFYNGQDGFGQQIAIDGNTIVIAATGADITGVNNGAVYVFRHTVGWEMVQVITPPESTDDDFGLALALDAGTLLITAKDGLVDRAVYSYHQAFGDEWVLEQKLKNHDAAPGCFDDGLVCGFGGKLALDGDVAVMAAGGDSSISLRQGSAYVFRREAGAWLEEGKLVAAEGLPGDGFGWDVAIDGDWIAVHFARDVPESIYMQGGATIFHYDGEVWNEEVTFQIEGTHVNQIDSSMEMFGPLLVLANSADDCCSDSHGAVHLFTRTGGSWNATGFLADGTAGNAEFGDSIALGAGTLVVGAKRDETEHRQGGAAFVYPIEMCGNRIIEGNETCDDGNVEDGDGCNAGCQIEGQECLDGRDNDGDHLADLRDPGCASAADSSERSPTLVCDDGGDNDADGTIDFPGDPGCRAATATIEDPACDDGIDNDEDGKTDWAGANGAEPDVNCTRTWKDGEEGGGVCGLGFEQVVLLPALMWLRRRRTSV
jgi:cysteine-rich repeat protein